MLHYDIPPRDTRLIPPFCCFHWAPNVMDSMGFHRVDTSFHRVDTSIQQLRRAVEDAQLQGKRTAEANAS